MLMWKFIAPAANGDVIASGFGFNPFNGTAYRCIFTALNSSNQTVTQIYNAPNAISSVMLNCGPMPAWPALVPTVFNFSIYEVNMTAGANLANGYQFTPSSSVTVTLVLVPVICCALSLLLHLICNMYVIGCYL